MGHKFAVFFGGGLKGEILNIKVEISLGYQSPLTTKTRHPVQKR